MTKNDKYCSYPFYQALPNPKGGWTLWLFKHASDARPIVTCSNEVELRKWMKGMLP